MQKFVARHLCGVELLTGSSQNLWQPAGQQLLLQPAKIIVPTDGLGECLQVFAGWRKHQLLIDLVLGSGAGGRLRQRFVRGAVRRLGVLAEHREEVVVSGLARVLPVAHRDGVNDVDIELGILEGVLDRHRRHVARWPAEGQGPGIDALTFLRRPLNVRFRINRSGEVIVQVAALGHFAQKGQQQVGVVANALEVALGGGLIGVGRTSGSDGRCRYD